MFFVSPTECTLLDEDNVGSRRQFFFPVFFFASLPYFRYTDMTKHVGFIIALAGLAINKVGEHHNCGSRPPHCSVCCCDLQMPFPP